MRVENDYDEDEESMSDEEREYIEDIMFPDRDDDDFSDEDDGYGAGR